MLVTSRSRSRRVVAIVMDEDRWRQALTRFQARSRGFLLRTEVLHSQTDFEEVLKEIQGTLEDLRWNQAAVRFPDFTQPGEHTQNRDRTTTSQHCGTLTENRDVSSLHCGTLTEDSVQSRANPQTGSGQSVSADGVSQTPQTSQTPQAAWTPEPPQAPQTAWTPEPPQTPRTALTPEPPRTSQTPRTLWIHRNTLTMELLWIQQAIGSRKKYLSLKDRLASQSQQDG